MRDFKKPQFGGQRGGGFNRANAGAPRFNAPGGRPNRGGDDGFRRSEMFEAVCANCGKRCEVPFRPNGQKPVYCRDCFGKQDHSAAPAGGGYPRKDFGARPSFQSARPPQENRDGRIDEIKKQLDAVNMKLDQLLNASRPSSSTPVSVKPAAVSTSTPKPFVAEVKAMEGVKPKGTKVSKKKGSAKKR